MVTAGARSTRADGSLTSVEQRERWGGRIKEAGDVESTLQICTMGQRGVILNALLDVPYRYTVIHVSNMCDQPENSEKLLPAKYPLISPIVMLTSC